MNQPVWKLVANLGDANITECGGRLVFKDATQVYPPEVEVYEAGDREVRRFSLERCELWQGHLIPYGFSTRTDLPYPIRTYVEWFDDSIERVALAEGWEAQILRQCLCSADVLERAQAYLALVEYHGIENFDDYPVTLTEQEAQQRYAQYEGRQA